MAGRIQFDRNKVLEAAVQVFWRKGFTGTSTEDIKKATGINESSLYNTFGNKESLFREALALYRDKIMGALATMPHLEKPKETIIKMLRRTARLATTKEGAAGCMLMNSAMELGVEYPEIAEYAKDTYRQMEEWMYQAVLSGQQLGELPSHHNARGLARYLTYNVQGMLAIARTSPSPEFMTDVVNTALSVLE